MPKIFIVRRVRFRHSWLINFATDCYDVHSSRHWIVFLDRPPQSTTTASFVSSFLHSMPLLLLGLVLVCSLSCILIEYFYAFIICTKRAAFPTCHIFIDVTNLITLSTVNSLMVCHHLCVRSVIQSCSVYIYPYIHTVMNTTILQLVLH